MRTLIIFVCLLTLLGVCHLSGQNLSGGIVLGFNTSQVDGDSDGGFRQIGPAVGAYVSYPLSDRMHLQPEILFEQLGSVSKGRFFAIRTSHISVPILLTFPLELDLGDRGQEIELQVGPVVGILLGAKDAVSGTDYSAVYRNPDFRMVAGAGFGLSDRWQALLRYGYSLISFLPGGTTNSFIRPGAAGLYHHYVHLSFRYRLGA